jgi:hypothetical protein
MKQAGRVLLFAALVAFAGSVLSALIPVQATAVEYVRETEAPKVVNCGSFPFRTEWSGDAGCDKARTRRLTQVMMVTLASGAIAFVGISLCIAGSPTRFDVEASLASAPAVRRRDGPRVVVPASPDLTNSTRVSTRCPRKPPSGSANETIPAVPLRKRSFLS